MSDKKESKEQRVRHARGKKKTSQKKGVFFFFIIILMAFSAFYYISQNANLRMLINEHEREDIKDPNLVKEAMEQPYEVGPEPPKTEDLEEGIKEGDEENINEDSDKAEENEPDTEANEKIASNPYEEIIEQESNEFDASPLKNRLDHYRDFIANANDMIKKYQHEEDISIELKNFKKQVHPGYISEIIRLFESYNKLQSERALKAERITQDEQAKTISDRLISKFIKIRKLDEGDRDFSQVKAEINSRLASFNEYLYSQELQDIFIK